MPFYNIRPRPQDETFLPKAQDPKAVTIVQSGAGGQIQTSTVQTAPDVSAAPDLMAGTPPDATPPAPDVSKNPNLMTATPPRAPAVPQQPMTDTRGPAERQLDTDNEQLARLRTAPLKKGNKFASFLKMFAIEAGEPFKQAPARNAQELVYGLSRGAGAGAVAAVRPEMLAKRERNYQIREAETRREGDLKAAATESVMNSRTATERYRQQRLEQMGVREDRLANDAERHRIAADLARLPYIDMNNEQHRKLLDEAQAAGFIIDKESFGQGKQPRMQMLDKDGVTMHWYERQANGEWKHIKTEEGEDATARVVERRDPLTGMTIGAQQDRAFARERFDFQKGMQKASLKLRERQVAAQEMAVRINASREQRQMMLDQAESQMADDYDELIDQAQTELKRTNLEDWEKEDLRKKVDHLREMAVKARAKGAAVSGMDTLAPSPSSTNAPSSVTEQMVRAAAARENKNPDEAVREARRRGVLPPAP